MSTKLRKPCLKKRNSLERNQPRERPSWIDSNRNRKLRNQLKPCCNSQLLFLCLTSNTRNRLYCRVIHVHQLVSISIYLIMKYLKYILKSRRRLLNIHMQPNHFFCLPVFPPLLPKLASKLATLFLFFGGRLLFI